MGYSHKITKLLLGATALTVISTGTAYAGGTAAGTSVSNTFTLGYTVGSTVQPTIDTGPSGTNTPTLFTVDRLVDLTITSNGDTTVAQGATDQELVFAFTNTGNADQDYVFSLFNEGGDQFDASGLTITYVADDGTAGYGAADAANLTASGFSYVAGSGNNSETIAPDTLYWIVVSGDIPASLTNLDEADVTLVADTAEDGTTGATAVLVSPDTGGNTLTGAAENVLADIDSDGAGTRDGANDGQYASTATYIVSDADLTADKTVSVFSQDGSGCATIPGTPVPGGYAVPGACVEYVITATNNGTAATANATAITLTDILNENLIYVDTAVSASFTGGTLTEPGTNKVCDPTYVGPLPGTGDDGVTCTVALSGASLAFGQTGTLTIRALVR